MIAKILDILPKLGPEGLEAVYRCAIRQFLAEK